MKNILERLNCLEKNEKRRIFISTIISFISFFTTLCVISTWRELLLELNLLGVDSHTQYYAFDLIVGITVFFLCAIFFVIFLLFDIIFNLLLWLIYWICGIRKVGLIRQEKFYFIKIIYISMIIIFAIVGILVAHLELWYSVILFLVPTILFDLLFLFLPMRRRTKNYREVEET